MSIWLSGFYHIESTYLWSALSEKGQRPLSIVDRRRLPSAFWTPGALHNAAHDFSAGVAWGDCSVLIAVPIAQLYTSSVPRHDYNRVVFFLGILWHPI